MCSAELAVLVCAHISGISYPSGSPCLAEGGCSVQIHLVEGWNLISFPLEPIFQSPDCLFEPLLQDGVLRQVRAYDAKAGQWRLYLPNDVGHPEWLDQDASLDLEGQGLHAGFGYWLLLEGLDENGSYSFTYDGTPLEAPSYFLPIIPGWNLVAPVDLGRRVWYQELGGHRQDLDSIWTWSPGTDYTGLGNLNETTPVGDLQWIEPKQGYWWNAEQGFNFEAPSASNLAGAVISLGGGESASFDIDRHPLACFGPEDTDAWDAQGAATPNKQLDPPQPGRVKMVVSLGGALIPAGVPNINGETAITGAAAIWIASHRPDLQDPE